MEEGRTISLKELLEYVLLRWRLLIICVIVFSVMAGGCSYLKSYNDAVQTRKEEQNPDFSQYENELRDSEIQEVEDSVEEYVSYRETYEKYKEYIDNSIKMQLDANAVPTTKIIYQISGNSELKNIGDTFVEIFPNNSVFKQIKEKTDWDVKSSYISELISVTNSDMATISLGEQSASNILENNDQENHPILLSIRIISDRQKNCEIMADIIDAELNAATVELQKQFGEFRIQKISESYGEETNKELLSTQQSCVNEMNTVSNVIKNIETSLSEQQQAYFVALLNSDNESSTTDSVHEEVTGLNYINIKYIILGIAAGIFVFVFYTMCKFLFNRHLISLNYIKNDLCSPLLEVFVGDNQKRKFGSRLDKWIRNFFVQKNETFSKDDRLQMLCTNIKVFMRKKNIEEIYLTGSISTTEISQFLQELKEYLDKYNITFVTGNSILYDANSLEVFTEKKGVVFIEQIGKSLNDEIHKELQYCDEYGVENIGFIVLE